jgi:hypothetical protein
VDGSVLGAAPLFCEISGAKDKNFFSGYLPDQLDTDRKRGFFKRIVRGR